MMLTERGKFPGCGFTPKAPLPSALDPRGLDLISISPGRPVPGATNQ